MQDKQNRCSEESIIDAEVLTAAVEAIQRHDAEKGEDKEPLDGLAGEPALRGYLGEALLQLAGKMALCGCPTEAVQGVHHDTMGLLAVTFEATRQAYRRLYAEFLPDPESGETPSDPAANAAVNATQRGRTEKNS